MRNPFSTELLRLANGKPSAIQAVAMKCMAVWAILGEAQAEADAQRDERLSFLLSLIDSALTLPDPDALEPAEHPIVRRGGTLDDVARSFARAEPGDEADRVAVVVKLPPAPRRGPNANSTESAD